MNFTQRVITHLPHPHLPRHDYTLRECLNGTAPVPQDPFGKGLFQLLMAGGMTTIMVTFNGILRDGPSFLADSHWLYPLILCISLGLRFLFANRLVAFLEPRLIPRTLRGFRRIISISALNVCLMAPIMGCVTTLLIHGPVGFFEQLASTLPLTAPVSLLVNVLVVGPTVKMIYHNVILPSTGTRLFQLTQRYATNWAGVFTF